jgi:hypothetical protein
MARKKKTKEESELFSTETKVAAPTNRLDIFNVLNAIHSKNRTFYRDLKPEEKKGFQDYITLRWMSGVNSGLKSIQGIPFDDFFLLLLNERVNKDFWSFDRAKHAELSYLVMTVMGIKPTPKHNWIPVPKRAKDYNTLDAFLLSCFPDFREDELKLWKRINNGADIEQLCKDRGMSDKEIQEFVNLYDEERRTELQSVRRS